MERDKNLQKIIKDHGLVSVPGNFTQIILEKISEATIPVSYKPIIGKKGRLLGLIIILFILLLAFLGPSKEAVEPLLHIPDVGMKLTSLHWKLPSGILAGMLAVFILILSDAGLAKRRI